MVPHWHSRRFVSGVSVSTNTIYQTDGSPYLVLQLFGERLNALLIIPEIVDNDSTECGYMASQVHCHPAPNVMNPGLPFILVEERFSSNRSVWAIIAPHSWPRHAQAMPSRAR